MDLLGGDYELIQVANNGITFHLRDTDNPRDEAWIKEKTLPTSDRVRANEWVCGGDMVTADYSARRNGVIVLHFRGVQSRK